MKAAAVPDSGTATAAAAAAAILARAWAVVDAGVEPLVVTEVVDARPVVGPELGVVAVVSGVVDVVVSGVVDVVVSGVDGPVDVGPGVLDVLVDEVAALVPVLVPVVLVGVTGAGSVVPANAAPGTTRVAARARASAAAGRALRRVRCMVPSQCERCRDGCTGTRT
jgi:hypothetical protein